MRKAMEELRVVAHGALPALRTTSCAPGGLRPGIAGGLRDAKPPPKRNAPHATTAARIRAPCSKSSARAPWSTTGACQRAFRGPSNNISAGANEGFEWRWARDVPPTPAGCDLTAQRHDVHGAGPAGCSAAITARLAGAEVHLYDPSPFPCHKVCGEFLSPEALPILDRLGVWDAISALRPARYSNLVLRFESRVVRLTLPARLRLAGLRSTHFYSSAPVHSA
jgi:hypothetical protein